MDDLLVHGTKAEHWLLIEQLFQSMVKNGLRLSPKKCQFFKTNLVYMGNEFVISQKNITVTPLRSRTEAHCKDTYSTHSETMQKFLWSCQLFSIILSRPTNTVKTHHSPYIEKEYPLDGEKSKKKPFKK